MRRMNNKRKWDRYRRRLLARFAIEGRSYGKKVLSCGRRRRKSGDKRKINIQASIAFA